VVFDASGPPSGRGPAPGAESGGAGEERRPLLGELLIQAKVVTAEQLAEALAAQREPVAAGTVLTAEETYRASMKIGQLLIERGWLTEAQLTQTLSLQLSVPWVSLYHIDFSRQLLNRVEREIAERHCLIPIFVRHVKGQGETLYVAMDDPTNEGALAEVSRQANLPARPMIASASDIRSAIRVYYGEPSTPQILDVPPPTRADPPNTTREGLGQRREPPAAVPAAAPPVAVEPPRASPVRPGSHPPPAPPVRRPVSVMPPAAAANAATAEEEPAPPTTRSNPPPGGRGAVLAAAVEGTHAPRVEPHAARSEAPAPDSRRGRARMLNLTLLDGTTLQLPAKKKSAVAADGLTARDFVSALRATAHGADATEILGEKPQWEPVVAALLSILLRKGLIADWEFIEELRKS
jgi:type IV pilus assembly protein PilB